MKLTKSQLKQIIKEEILKTLNETQLDAIPDVNKSSAKEMAQILKGDTDYKVMMKGTYIYQLNSARRIYPDQAKKIDQTLEMLGWTEEAMNHRSRKA
tara:strand:- start:1864 stop:2154 length:291 start_codon:yes stop_codon:yes gene_type:complete